MLLATILAALALGGSDFSGARDIPITPRPAGDMLAWSGVRPEASLLVPVPAVLTEEGGAARSCPCGCGIASCADCGGKCVTVPAGARRVALATQITVPTAPAKQWWTLSNEPAGTYGYGALDSQGRVVVESRAYRTAPARQPIYGYAVGGAATSGCANGQCGTAGRRGLFGFRR